MGSFITIAENTWKYKVGRILFLNQWVMEPFPDMKSSGCLNVEKIIFASRDQINPRKRPVCGDLRAMRRPVPVSDKTRLLFVRLFQYNKGHQGFFMEIIFKLWINLYCLGIHLGNDPAVFQQFVDSDEVLIVIDVLRLGKIAAVADVDYFLHGSSPL